MPKVFEQDGFKFFFYSNDHRPIHIHVTHGGAEAVFVVEGEIELRESVGMKIKELQKAKRLIKENAKLIERKWHEYRR